MRARLAIPSCARCRSGRNAMQRDTRGRPTRSLPSGSMEPVALGSYPTGVLQRCSGDARATRRVRWASRQLIIIDAYGSKPREWFRRRGGSRSSGCRRAVHDARSAHWGRRSRWSSKDRIRRHQPGELFQRASADRSALRREPPPLDAGEPQATSTELLAKHAVLFLEVLDDDDLAAVHPAREHQEQELERRH